MSRKLERNSDAENEDKLNNYLAHLQLLHKAHNVEHHLSSYHLVLFVKATLQHTMLYTRTALIAQKI